MATPTMMHEVIETEDGQQVILEYPPGGREAAIAQAEESELAKFLENVRRAVKGEQLVHADFEEETYRRKLAQLAAFVDKHGRMPGMTKEC